MRYFISFLLLILVSCQKNIVKKDINLINGYWEIVKVEFPNGQEKVYKFSESVDFFKLNDSLKGYRKKLVPQFDGKFLTNEVNEKISISFNEDLVMINYATEFAKWTEIIMKLNDDELILSNEQGINYIYKRKKITNE
ncbi:hypothetical protein [Flavobacterium okayamense]|uniref:Lipocalin-like domain-containing protein n=1 Tax=Flavobacterium okayamense TaxID=2830782 RepID=A0ABN6HYU1_9FLAO|nr:hypothetical protein [Flavobacterium okayamense]BCY28555.1 hypothetical protein KK2020170_14230 [Flavobacterium okayamense]